MILIDKNILDGVSTLFQIGKQSTVWALGLEDTDYVEISMVKLSDLPKQKCVCPPGRVEFADVIDEVPLACCGTPIRLTRERPFVVLDAPQKVNLRARLVREDEDEPLTTQVVMKEETDTHNVNDRLRGCPCSE